MMKRGISRTPQPRDLIGPVDTVSNLRPIKYVINFDETKLEEKLRKQRNELQNWNQLFWVEHNKCFKNEKKKFESKILEKKNLNDQIITADEMSIFYKQFLDKNWKNHLSYLLTWYKKNILVTVLHLRVMLVNFQKTTFDKLSKLKS
ncbi:protein C14orf153 precursor, putative [Pediculus humanus corporis]|uniref:Protein C14orf153, putative n=1 Tax=Pediculus humanus subsp. corporis TaxID=121224 RepID=E0W2D8_PEDHC|nr:protein C14orf153 precursor, putative [Pediculus humanus corporis]EEB19794.1 protein C14orf153 precursor, putative [Pediculus humanus corporis]